MEFASSYFHYASVNPNKREYVIWRSTKQEQFHLMCGYHSVSGGYYWMQFQISFYFYTYIILCCFAIWNIWNEDISRISGKIFLNSSGDAWNPHSHRFLSFVLWYLHFHSVSCHGDVSMENCQLYESSLNSLKEKHFRSWQYLVISRIRTLEIWKNINDNFSGVCFSLFLVGIENFVLKTTGKMTENKSLGTVLVR